MVFMRAATEDGDGACLESSRQGGAAQTAAGMARETMRPGERTENIFVGHRREMAIAGQQTECDGSAKGARIAVHLEGKRMASGHTGNVVPGNRLWVRVPCPPLKNNAIDVARRKLFAFGC